MLSALIATPAILKAGSANAFSPERAEELNLTPQQQTELDAIKDNARTQVEAIFTDDQLAELADTTGREQIGRASCRERV